MAKVLITSIGSGNPNKERYAYSSATYFNADEPDGELCVTPLVAEALKQLHGIDELILVGTSGSSWMSLYEYIHSDDNKNFGKQTEYNDDYHVELLDIFLKRDSERLSVDDMRKVLEPLKETMGRDCREICVLEYGSTPDEQLKNLTILNKLAESLKDGDIVYFDISHAFRSLPFYELLAVNLAKNILQRDIRIEMVSYAMLEASKTYGGKTPVVDMTQLIELLDWTRAVDEYNRKGQFVLLHELWKGKDNKIGERIDKQLSNKTRKAFKVLVETMSSDIHNHDDLQTMVNLSLEALSNPNKVLEHPILMIIQEIMKQVTAHFEPYKDDHIALLLASVLWKIKKGQLVLGALLLVEAIESACIDVVGGKLYDNNLQNKIHEKLVYAPPQSDKYVRDFVKRYNELRKEIRNKLAHGKNANVENLSLHLENAAIEFLVMYVEQFAPGKPKRELLKGLFT